MHKFFYYSLLALIIVGCTPYGSPKEEVQPVQEYREELTEDYVERVNNKYKEPEKKQKPQQKQQQVDIKPNRDSLVDIHKLWWYKKMHSEESKKAPVTLKDLYVKTLNHSNQVKVFSDIPIIRSTGIQEAEGEFDPVIYAEGGYNRVNEPVGNVLKTGDDNDFKENELYFEAGIKKKFSPGTEVQVSEKLQRIQNNSEFTDPNPQSIATLSVSIIQPLLRGAGIEYNESLYRLAKIDSKIAKKEFKRQLETHLLEVTRAYWALYLAQASLTLRREMVKNIEDINREIKQRSELDALQSEIYHTESALAFHRARIIRAETVVKNSRDRLLTLINDPQYIYDSDTLVLGDIPFTKWNDIELKKSLLQSMRNRPELEQAYLQIRASTIRLNMTKNELLPILDGIVEFAFTGLRAENDMGGAIGDQFAGGDPGARFGFRFEYPIWNRKARARHTRRQVEKRQLINQFKTTMENVLFEVKVSIREVETTYQEFLARQKAFVAAQKEINALKNRRVLETVLQGNKGVSSFLQALLQSQNNYLETQFQLVKSMIDYNLAITNLKRSEGTFLSFENIETVIEEDENGLPMWRTVINSYEDKYTSK
ncbi:TolC family protein [Candidatus Uabimicrobium amorphum]|uniref:Outer membrane channel protein n=1 Tax=Uabimicrobium amorphum TaxID=2596890 RepID=A0A5S9IPX0_UABAM|nr:TolC family protein [Candidatus Uabimicrobium amorphum]BBM85282.1 outer membrane channel protein [Candidatus Uabimicrobium amorphum]